MNNGAATKSDQASHLDPNGELWVLHGEQHPHVAAQMIAKQCEQGTLFRNIVQFLAEP